MQQRPNHGLLYYVQKGSKQEVAKLLRRGKVNINEADADGFTPLMEAAMNNHIAILSSLIENGADINAVNRLGRNALIEAAARGHAAIVLRLCQARPLLDHRNKFHPLKLTALMEAASRGHDAVVFWLCEARADVNIKNAWGDTALIMAANNNRIGCLLLLLSFRADTTLAGDGNLTALEVARAQGHTRIVDILGDPLINDPQYLQRLYLSFKSQYKDRLQDEVNYDAAISSRPLPVVGPSTDDVEWEWEEYLELIPKPEDDIEKETEALRDSLLKVSMNDMLIHTGGIREKYKWGENHYEIKPLFELPKFGETIWLATQPTRTPRQSKFERIKQHNHILKTQMSSNQVTEHSYPYLRLFDNGTWIYCGDIVSGALEGTFQFFYIMTIPTEKAILKAENHEFVEDYGDNNKIFYLIRLTAPPQNNHADFQLANIVLNKQIVLGRLILEMADNEEPWWKHLKPIRQ